MANRSPWVPGLERYLGRLKDQHVRVATAFLKPAGVEALAYAKPKSVDLIAGIDFAITDPEALKAANHHKWNVRVAQSEGRNTFHPKLYWCWKKPQSAYVGSANLTGGGLGDNRELGVLIERGATKEDWDSLARTWDEWWSESIPLRKFDLEGYQADFYARRDHDAHAPRRKALAIRPVRSMPAGSCFVIWARAYGESHSVLQAPHHLASFFEVGPKRRSRDVWVTLGDWAYRVDVHYHLTAERRPKVLQLNLGKSKLHIDAERQLTRRNLLAFESDGTEDGYRLHVIPRASAEGESLMRACGVEPDDFTAAIRPAP